MNFRSRELLDLAHELPCTARITSQCGNSASEPAHANEAVWGKGKSLKAHDFAFAAMCRSCHAELDQGSQMSRESRQFVWLRGHIETMRLLWERGLLAVTATPVARDPRPSRERRRRTERSTSTPSKVFPRNPRQLA